MASLIFGGYYFMVPDNNSSYNIEQKKSVQISWSVDGNFRPSSSAEYLLIESKDGEIERFNNDQQEYIMNNWNGDQLIYFYGTGSFDLKFKRWNDLESKYITHHLTTIKITKDESSSGDGGDSLATLDSLIRISVENSPYIGVSQNYSVVNSSHRSIRWIIDPEYFYVSKYSDLSSPVIKVTPIKSGASLVVAEIYEKSTTKFITKKDYTANIKPFKHGLHISSDSQIVPKNGNITYTLNNITNTLEWSLKYPEDTPLSVFWMSDTNLELVSGQNSISAKFEPTSNITSGYAKVTACINIALNNDEIARIVNTSVWIGTPKVKQEQILCETDMRDPIILGSEDNFEDPAQYRSYKWEYVSGSKDYEIIEQGEKLTIKPTLKATEIGEIVFKRIASNEWGNAEEYYIVNIKEINWSKALKLSVEKISNNEYIFNVDYFKEYKEVYPNARVEWSRAPGKPSSETGFPAYGEQTILSEGRAKYTVFMEYRYNSDYTKSSGYEFTARIYNESHIVASLLDYVDCRDQPYLLDEVARGGTIKPYENMIWFTVQNLRALGSKEDGYELDQITSVSTFSFPTVFEPYIYNNYIEIVFEDFGNDYTSDMPKHADTTELVVTVRLKNDKEITLKSDPFTIVYFDPDQTK